MGVYTIFDLLEFCISPLFGSFTRRVHPIQPADQQHEHPVAGHHRLTARQLRAELRRLGQLRPDERRQRQLLHLLVAQQASPPLGPFAQVVHG